MPPTVMTPWFTACCGVCVVLVGLVAPELEPPELGFAPELFPAGLAFPAELVFPPEAVWALGAAPLLRTCAPYGVPPLLDGAGVAAGAPLLGAAVPELLLGADV